MAYAAVRSKVVVPLLLLIYCLMYFPLSVGVLSLSLFCYALLCVHFGFAIILIRKRKLVVLLVLSYGCIFTRNVMWLILICVVGVVWLAVFYAFSWRCRGLFCSV